VAERRVLISWSSGKDSAWTLHALRQDRCNRVEVLLTTVTREFDRVSMHGVRRDLLESQAKAAGVDLWTVSLPNPCTNEQYEAAMNEAMDRAKAAGITAVAFGDLFLEAVRQYREAQLAKSGLELLFPLWGRSTTDLSAEMLDQGLRAKITCVDPTLLPASFSGREYDKAFLSDLPASVDPCGENGEFHTFAYAGPMFREPVAIQPGETLTRDGFVFSDLLLARR
jgi:uncharacterized protein (TIGR00290 family)